ncbi:MAG TPA: SRPBCC family protein [Gemmatimonadales bacterium]
MAIAVKALLRLWFSFDVPVSRRTYLLHGTALMVVKYLMDSTLIQAFAQIRWTPLDYLNPLWSLRADLANLAPSWLPPALVLLTLPFLWIGVGMSARRAADAGRSPWVALLFFVPGLNYLLMAALAVLPPLSRVQWPVEPPPPQVDERLKSAMLGVAAAVAITLVSLGIGVYLRRAYSAGLFLGVPFTIGYITAYIHNRRFPRSPGESVVLAVAGVAVACGAVVAFALEGLVCIIMALPVGVAIAIPGALLGRAVALRSVDPAAGVGAALVLAPLLVAVEPHARPMPREVVSVVEIDAPPRVVWRHVVTFPELAPADDWLFRLGVAAPLAARIDGRGVGAVRYCDFTTGSFVEPIVAWEEGRLLAFEITEQAAPMRELSPYGDIRAPHLDGYFRATYGEFRLEELPGTRTRLVGRTRYEVNLFPQIYWTLFANRIVEAIHLRVLQHIEGLAESQIPG